MSDGHRAEERMDLPGVRILQASWVATALFAVTAIPAALGADALDDVAVGVSLLLFALGIVVWVVSYARALVRSAQGEAVSVPGMYLWTGPVPRPVRTHLYASLGVTVVVAIATAAAEPFGILVPLLPLCLVGLWGARHGTYPPRRMGPAQAPRR